jgi:hypothetical protein
MENCDCLIGYISGEEIKKSEFKEKVNDIVRIQPELKRIGLLTGEPLSFEQIIDNRRGYLHKFCFCPYCGKKLDWKKIKKINN